MSDDEVKEALADESRLRQRRWLRVLLLVSLAILLVVLGSEFPEYKEPSRHPQVATVGPDDQLIAPGERVGFIRLGLHIAAVEERLGRGRAKPTQTAVLYRFDTAGLFCAVQRGQVSSVLVSNPIYKTHAGLSVGSDADLVVRELGDEYEYEPLEKNAPPASPTPGPGLAPNGTGMVYGYTLHYWREGIHVNLVHDKVETVLIMAPTNN
ncbi:hypothetical protein IV102_30645 [bacterium]|nr:hypothetical protein [bacterium]